MHSHTNNLKLRLINLIDKSGNLVVVELKRDKLPRDVLTQAIDYASDVSSWDVDKLSEICTRYTNQGSEDYLSEKFEEIDLEDLTINKTQRILLVGFSIEESLQRMIEWLSNNYGVSINAVILKYVKTRNDEELIARTVIIPEEVEKERTRKRQFKISMSRRAKLSASLRCYRTRTTGGYVALPSATPKFRLTANFTYPRNLIPNRLQDANKIRRFKKK